MLERMHKKRLKVYAKLGYEIATIDENETVSKNAQFVLHHEALRALISDITSATHSINLVAPYASLNAANSLIEPLSSAIHRGIRVECHVVKQPNNAIIKEFAAADVPLTVDPTLKYSCLAVFDEKTIWYGTLPLLAFAQKGDCSVRIESAEAAYDLLAELDLEDKQNTFNHF